MKKKFSKEAKIGVAFLVAVFMLYYGISFLKGVNIFKPANSFYVAFDDVTGLTVSSPVVINGYQIGLVNSLTLSADNKKVITVLNLNKGVKIPKGSSFKIDAGMLGGSKIMFAPSTHNEYYSSEDTIPGSRVIGMMESVSSVLPAVSDLVPKLDSILSGLQSVVNHPALTNSLGNVDKMTTDLAVSTKQLNLLLRAVSKDVPVITSNLSIASQDLAGFTSQVKSIDLVSTYTSIDATLKNIESLSSRINSKDNSIGLLLNDRQLYDSIATTLNNASLLLKDVKENPSRYINVKVF